MPDPPNSRAKRLLVFVSLSDNADPPHAARSTWPRARRLYRIGQISSAVRRTLTRVKIALKYGLLITLGVIAWVVVAHLLVPDPRSPVHNLFAFVFFNLLEIAGIYFAINVVRNESGGALNFKRGVKTGIATALVYALTSCLFFVVAILTVGPRLMAGEPGAEYLPVWQVAAGAFVGLFVGSLVFGLIYSTLISFFLAKRKGR